MAILFSANGYKYVFYQFKYLRGSAIAPSKAEAAAVAGETI